MPLTQLRALDSNIRGILGMNFLLHFSFRLDFEHSALELYPFPEAARVPAGLRMAVEINESRLLIAVASKAAPRGSWKLALDSGISQFLVFQDRLAAASDRCLQADCLMQVSTNLAAQEASTRLLMIFPSLRRSCRTRRLSYSATTCRSPLIRRMACFRRRRFIPCFSTAAPRPSS